MKFVNLHKNKNKKKWIITDVSMGVRWQPASLNNGKMSVLSYGIRKFIGSDYNA